MSSTQPEQIASFIHHSSAFSQLDGQARNALASRTRMLKAHEGEILVHRGDRPAGLFLLVEGELKLSLVSSEGAERVLRLVEAGETVCEESVFEEAPHPLALQTTRDSLLLFIPRAAVLAAMTHSVALAHTLLARLSRRLCSMVLGMEQCEQRNGAQRVAHYLIEHARHDEGAAEVRLKTTKQMVASQLNMTPENFSRVLSRFSRDGLIHARGHRAIRLTDYSGLRSLAC